MSRIEDAGAICLGRPKPTQGCRADHDDDDDDDDDGGGDGGGDDDDDGYDVFWTRAAGPDSLCDQALHQTPI